MIKDYNHIYKSFELKSDDKKATSSSYFVCLFVC